MKIKMLNSSTQDTFPLDNFACICDYYDEMTNYCLMVECFHMLL